MEAPMMSPHIILEKDLKSQWLYHSKGMAWTLKHEQSVMVSMTSTHV